MSFNPSSVQEGRDGGHEQPPSASTELTPTVTATAASHVYSGEQHKDYDKIVAPGVVCDGCEGLNTSCVQKCKTCGWTTCLVCHTGREYEHRHILTDLNLDWSYDSSNHRQEKRSMSVDGGNEAQPVAKRPKSDNASERNPAAETVGVSQDSSSQDVPSRETPITSETQPSINQTNVNTNGKGASDLDKVSAQEDEKATRRTRSGKILKPLPKADPMPMLPTNGSSFQLELRTRKGANGGPNNSPSAQPEDKLISLGPGGRVPIDPNTGRGKKITLQATKENYIAMAIYWEQQGRYVEAETYHLLADEEDRKIKLKLAAKNRGTKSKKSPKPAPTVVDATENAKKDSQGSESQQQVTTFTYATSSEATTGNTNAIKTPLDIASLVMATTNNATSSEANTSNAITSSVTTGNVTAGNVTAGNVTPRNVTTSQATNNDVNMEETSPKQTTTNETNLNNTNIGGNTHISINLGLGASGLEWDKEAFPGADKSRVIEYLMKGGQKTVEHSQQLHSLEHYSHPPRYVTDIKAALSIDPWAVKEPEGFEHQWGQIEALVLRWHEDKCGFPSDCIRGSGDDPIRKLEMWMGLYNPVAVQASFWQIWVEGMRQARQARQAQQEPKSD